MLTQHERFLAYNQALNEAYDRYARGNYFFCPMLALADTTGSAAIVDYPEVVSIPFFSDCASYMEAIISELELAIIETTPEC